MVTLTVSSALVDTSPPALSTPAANASGTSSWTGSVSVSASADVWAVISTSTSQPSHAQGSAGQDHTGATAVSASQLTNQTGTVSFSGAGLSPSTQYYAHYGASNANGTSTVVTSSAFTTSAAGSGTVAISTLKRSENQIAPEGVWFQASVSGFDVTEDLNASNYDPSFHRLRYRWTFTRSGYTSTSDKVVNLATAHNDLTVAYGKRVAHVFTEPGTYTVTCEVQDASGTTGSNSTSITVGDPATAFTGAANIVVDQTGTHDHGLTGATEVTSIAAAMTALDARATPSRVLLKRGQSYSETVGVTSAYPNVYFDAWGTGPRPVMVPGASNAFRPVGGGIGDVQIRSVRIAGGWNTQTESGDLSYGINCSSTTDDPYIVVDDCEFDGCVDGIITTRDSSSSDNGKDTHVFVHNTSFDNWKRYAIFCEPCASSRISLTGVALRQEPNALQGGRGQNGAGNEQGCIRVSWSKDFYSAGCDYFSRCGWTQVQSVPSDQPCIRFNTLGRAGSSATVERCSLEGGDNPILLSLSSGSTSHLTNFVADKCLIVGAARTSTMFVSRYTGVTMRNSICVKPNSPWYGKRYFGGINCEAPSGLQDPAAPVQVYNNTIVCLLNLDNKNNVSSIYGAQVAGALTSVNSNNAQYTPNLTGFGANEGDFDTLDGSTFSTVGGTWSPRFIGFRWFQATALNTSFATPSGTVTDFTPTASTASFEDASGVVAIDDFFGTLRGANPDRGAIES